MPVGCSTGTTQRDAAGKWCCGFKTNIKQFKRAFSCDMHAFSSCMLEIHSPPDLTTSLLLGEADKQQQRAAVAEAVEVAVVDAETQTTDTECETSQGTENRDASCSACSTASCDRIPSPNLS